MALDPSSTPVASAARPGVSGERVLPTLRSTGP